MKAQVLEIVTGIGNDAELLRRHDFFEADDEFGTSDTARQRDMTTDSVRGMFHVLLASSKQVFVGRSQQFRGTLFRVACAETPYDDNRHRLRSFAH